MADRPAADPSAQHTARTLARLLWDRDFRRNNPTATAAAKRADWESTKAAYMRDGRHFAARLAKTGFTLTPPAEPKA